MRGPTQLGAGDARGRRGDEEEEDGVMARLGASDRDGGGGVGQPAVASVWAPKQGPEGLKYGGAPYLASLLRLNGGECLKYRRGGFRNSV